MRLEGDDARPALADAEKLAPEAAAARFSRCAAIVRSRPMSDDIAIEYGDVTTTFAVVAEIASMEAKVPRSDLGGRGARLPGRSSHGGAGDPVMTVTPFTAN